MNMFKDKNKISNEELYGIVCRHTGILEKVFEVLLLLTEKGCQRDKTIAGITQHINLDSNTGQGMDSLCGLWKTSPLKPDSAILISKLPGGKYVFSYRPAGAQYSTSTYITGSILEEPATYVDVDGEEIMIFYVNADEGYPEAILFNKTLYFRNAEF